MPVALSDVVMKLLAKAPEYRYQTAAGLVADLQQCLSWKPPAASSRSRSARMTPPTAC